MISLLFIHIILAIIWAAVGGEFTFLNFLIGLVLGYFVLLWVSQPIDGGLYTRTVRKSLVLAVYFVKELFLSSLRVAKDVMKPGFSMRSGVVAIPLDMKSDLGITLLANLISLTPGTLSIDVSDDRNYLYIHAMYIDTTADDLREEIRQGMEYRVKEVVEPQ